MADGITEDLQNLSLYSSPSDSDKVDQPMIELLSQWLCGDWKRFAYQFLDDNVIEKIDLDNRSAEEKIRAFFREWFASSKITVTKMMVKLKLHDLRRIDILLKLQQGNSLGAVPIEVRIPQPQASERTGDPTVEELKKKDIQQFITKLDVSMGSGISNWIQLAREVMGSDEKLSDSINDLQLHYSGGGNPALRFLLRLATTHPLLRISRFQKTAQSLNRNDVSHHLKVRFRHMCDEPIAKIPLAEKESLASLLNATVPGINDWEMFADDYNYTYPEIQLIKNARKEENSYSPTEKLFDILRQVRPKLKLKTLGEHCRAVSRNDVALLLDEISDEIIQVRRR